MNNNLFDKKNKNINLKVRNIYQHNIYIREMTFPDSHTTYCGHHHFYDHVTLVASGRVRVKFDSIPQANIPEEIKEYGAVDMFVTRSFRTHEITSLEPNTVVCCIHALREKDGNILEPEVLEEHKHNTDLRYSKEEMLAIAKNTKRISLDANSVELGRLLKRGDKEGTAVPGSQDKFHN